MTPESAQALALPISPALNCHSHFLFPSRDVTHGTDQSPQDHSSGTVRWEKNDIKHAAVMTAWAAWALRVTCATLGNFDSLHAFAFFMSPHGFSASKFGRRPDRQTDSILDSVDSGCPQLLSVIVQPTAAVTADRQRPAPCLPAPPCFPRLPWLPALTTIASQPAQQPSQSQT